MVMFLIPPERLNHLLGRFRNGIRSQKATREVELQSFRQDDSISWKQAFLPDLTTFAEKYIVLEIYNPMAIELDRLVTNKKRLVAMPTTTSACIFMTM